MTEPDHFIQLGGFVAPLSEQLADLKVPIDPKIVAHFQLDMEAISRLYLRHLIPYSLAQKAYEKLIRNIHQAALDAVQAKPDLPCDVEGE